MVYSAHHLIFYLLCVLSFSNTEAKCAHNKIPKLLVISYDGFRYDFFKRNFTPILEGLKFQGTHAEYMKNVFETKTLPNHHTIATGLYPEDHGVVDGEVYDPKVNKTLKYSKELYQYNPDILPIWTLNEATGGGRRSGTIWAGAEFEYHGINITFSQAWNISIPWEERVNTLLSWFNHPKNPINLGMLYIEEPDFHGHAIGVNSERFNDMLKKMDQITKYLHDKLKEQSLEDVNVIHLSDHGMTTVTLERIIDLDKFVNPEDYTVVGPSPVMMIYPRQGKKQEIYDRLKEASNKTQQFDIYFKEEIPERYHFSKNRRIGPILIVAKAGFAFHTIRKKFPFYEKYFNISINEKSELGVHGYDNDVHEMHPFFFGLGPAFVPKCEISTVSILDMFPLFCEILNLEYNSANGSVEHLKKCLTKYQTG